MKWETTRIEHLVIEPSSRWRLLDGGDLWRYRELFLFLIWRDIKVRYKQTTLGAAWAVLQPLGSMAIFTVLFARMARIESDGLPYPLFVFAGLLPWTFFANAVGSSGNSLVGSAHLITKVYFPRTIIPAAAVLAGLADFGVSLTVMGLMMAWYRVTPGPGLLLLIPLVALTTTFALAVGMWLSAMQVRYRDVRYLIPFMLQIWMFATPIVYPAGLAPASLQWVLAINPMSGLIEGYRAALLGGLNGAAIDWVRLGAATGVILFALLLAIFSFRRMERTFADLV